MARKTKQQKELEELEREKAELEAERAQLIERQVKLEKRLTQEGCSVEELRVISDELASGRHVGRAIDERLQAIDRKLVEAKELERLALVADRKGQEAEAVDRLLGEGLPGLVEGYLQPLLDAQTELRNAGAYPSHGSVSGTLVKAIRKVNQRVDFQRSVGE